MIRNSRKVVLFSLTDSRYPFKRSTKGLISCFIVVMTVAILSITTSASALSFELTPYKATYKAKIKGFTTNLSTELEQEQDGTWQLTNKATLFFADFTERSRFNIKDNNIVPSSYTYRDETLRYDWDKKTVLAKDDKKTKTLKLTANTLDKLSYLAQIRIDFLGKGKQQKDYRLIDGTRDKGYTIQKIGEEKIKTPIGKYDTIVLEQLRGESSRTRIWLDKNNRGLIIKLKKYNDKEVTYSLDLIKKK